MYDIILVLSQRHIIHYVDRFLNFAWLVARRFL
nr:MAG TPA: hypothetical protein [Caudoviricetes sp.]